MDAKMKEEYDRLCSYMDKRLQLEQAVCKTARNSARRLRKRLVINHDILDWDSIVAAPMIATFLDEFVHHSWQRGEELQCIEWALDHLMRLYIERFLPDMRAIHDALKERGHTQRNRLVWNDLDNKTFYIPAKGEIRIWVTEGQSVRWLIYDGKPSHKHVVHVRRIWHKNNQGYHGWYWQRYKGLRGWKKQNYLPEYGDCRDSGYVFSYEVRDDGISRGVNYGWAMMGHIQRFATEIGFLLAELDKPCETDGTQLEGKT